ncbi:hypothetical protein BDR04DRAFT_1086434 [Suillus decipiens]|nr:hypothetical protein BDR04DRAFT_1086434 [Suillus decipiens]
MGSIVPWDGVYHIQNVGYPDQKMGLQIYLDALDPYYVAGRHEDSLDPRIEWKVKATKVGQGLYSKIVIQSDSQGTSNYVGADSDRVVYRSEPYEWDVPYREVGRWVIKDPASGLLLYLPGSEDGVQVQLTEDVAGEMSYWRFIPFRPSSE